MATPALARVPASATAPPVAATEARQPRAVASGRLGGHHLEQLRVSPPPPAAPLQAAGLFDAYSGAKARLGRGYDRVSSFAGGVKDRVMGSAPVRGLTRVYRGAQGVKNRFAAKVRSTGLYRKGAALHGDVKAIGKDLNKTPAFQKFRAVLGMLGIAGGYQQGYGSTADPGRGSEARGAFRDRWEKYLGGLPEDQQPAARLKYSLPEREEDPQAGPRDIEMQEFPLRRGPEGGIAPPRNRFDEHFEPDN